MPSRKSVASQTRPRSKSKGAGTSFKISAREKRLLLQQRRIERIQARSRELKRQERVKAAVRRFRPRKSERGKIVLVNFHGKRTNVDKGKKGFAVYVTKTKGKKQLLHSHGKEWTPRTVADTSLPIRRNLKNAVADFNLSRLEIIGHGKKRRAPVKASGLTKVKGRTGGYDFNKRVVKGLAKGIKRALDSQVSKRRFLITAFVLTRLPDGTSKVFEVSLPIDRPDHIAIELGGIENFVSQKFYAFMARQLAFDGYVTAGSANHIRHRTENQGLEQAEWTGADGELWRGSESEIVTIESIDWKVEQAK